MHLFKGVTVALPRNMQLMMVFFSTIDTLRRNTELMTTKFGQFMVAAIAGCAAWTSVWPYEVIKNLAQAETKGAGNNNL